MKIVFVLTYPIYHDFWDKNEWLNLINQNRWIPGILTSMGYETEFWVVDKTSSEHRSSLQGFGDYQIRMFKNSKNTKQTKFHYSQELVDYAKLTSPDLFILKGVDGGIGKFLIDNHLIKSGTPFVMLIGGEYYSPRNKYAKLVIYESNYQKNKLINPGIFFWRHKLNPSSLLKIEKSIDTEVFKPYPEILKKFDAISVGRIVKKNKRFDEIGELSNKYRVAVVGDGPMKETLQKKYPNITWLNKVPNSQLPKILAQSRTYIHPSPKDFIITRDFYPRSIAEALACGIPCIGFSDALQEDIIPKNCGFIVKRKSIKSSFAKLIKDPAKLEKLGGNARKYALTNLGKHSAEPVLKEMLKRMGYEAR